MNRKLNVVQYNASLQKLASSFHSGNWYLDQFLRQNIALDENYGKTYVLLSQNNKCIIGYYNLSTGYLESVEENQVRKIGGAVHINCFALTEQYCIFRKNRALAPHERSAVPLGTDHCPVC